MGTSVPLLLIILFHSFRWIYASLEGDALNALKTKLDDPNHVFQTWDPGVDLCSWFHVACNTNNNVVRLDLGNASLSGELVPELGHLNSLQHLEFYSNNITKGIVSELGNLTSLEGLDLFNNHLTGCIPETLCNLKKLRSLRLNNNSLSGPIPMCLTSITTLELLDMSHNNLSGPVPVNGSFSNFTPLSFANNKYLCGVEPGKPCPP